jgi:hypothetical protein
MRNKEKQMSTTVVDNTVVIPRVIDKDELWSEVFGSAWEMNEWWLDYSFVEGNWDKHGSVSITAINPLDDGKVTRVLTIDDIVTAYTEIVNGEHYHCGGSVSIDDMDMCAGDLVIQQAMFGDVFYV